MQRQNLGKWTRGTQRHSGTRAHLCILKNIWSQMQGCRSRPFLKFPAPAPAPDKFRLLPLPIVVIVIVVIVILRVP